MDLISVIVPVYNSEKYLKKCLRSICAQSYPHLEILLVDDGSTDQSGGICDDFAGRDRRVRVIHQQNGGEIKARHTGIAHAKGKYLAFVDADDWIDPDFIAYLYGLLQKHHTEIASCALIREYPKKSVVSFGKEGETVYPAAQAVGLLHGTSRHGGGGISCSLWDKLFLKDLFRDVRYQNVSIGGDYCLTVQLVSHGSRIVSGGRALYHYRQHSDSVCYQGYSGDGFAIMDAYTRMKNYTLERFPQLEEAVVSFWLLQEMAIVISMVKSNWYDNEVIQRVRLDIAKWIKPYLRYRTVPFYLKICALLLLVHHKLLTVPYKYLFKYRYTVRGEIND